MSGQEQTVSSSPLDSVKWILSILVLAGAVYANHYLVDDSVLIRAGVVIVLVAIGLAIGFSTTKGRAGLAFAKESRVEARKVIWPTRNETIQTTLIIIVAVSLVSLLLYFIDWALVSIINLLTLRG